MIKLVAVSLFSVALAGCAPSPTPTAETGQPHQGTAQATNQTDIKALSDEFDSSASLANWKHIHKTEGWNNDQLEQFGVDGGQLTLIPYASSWYMEYRGILVYKDVPGDFVVTTKLQTTGRDGRSAPRVLYSLGGIMVRSPRSDNARTWRPGGENYVFLSLGCADQPGNFQFEVKTTERSNSVLEKIPAAGGQALLQVAKVGPHLILLRKQGNAWAVHKRYYRPDMPNQMQVGLTVYTDWNSVSPLTPQDHNARVIRNGNPDLIAKFDYVHYQRPKVPAGTDLQRASDADLIRMFGDSAS